MWLLCLITKFIKKLLERRSPARAIYEFGNNDMRALDTDIRAYNLLEYYVYLMQVM